MIGEIAPISSQEIIDTDRNYFTYKPLIHIHAQESKFKVEDARWKHILSTQISNCW